MIEVAKETKRMSTQKIVVTQILVASIIQNLNNGIGNVCSKTEYNICTFWYVMTSCMTGKP